jgi:hypothetical protein
MQNILRETLHPGIHEVIFNPGSHLQPGIYMVVIHAGRKQATIKLVITG